MITPSFGLTATERVLPKLALDFTTASLDSRITFTRTTGASNPATYVNSNGFVTAATNDQPRFDYNPVTLACKGLLIEESRVNRATYSSDFSSGWTVNSTILMSSSTLAPDGVNNAKKLVVNSGTVTYASIFQGLSLAVQSTASCYFKANEKTVAWLGWLGGSNGAYFDLNSVTVTTFGSGTTGTMTAVGNGWYRCSITYTYTSGNNNVFIGCTDASGSMSCVGNGTDGLYIWGAQHEAGAFATSYIPTTTTALTRNADVATITGANFSNWWKATTGGVLARGHQLAISGIRPWVQFDDGTTNNLIALRGNTTNPELYIKTTTDQAQIDAGSIAANTSYGLFGSWNTNNCAAAINGASPVTDTTATIPTVTQARFGYDGANYLNGWLEKIMYWSQRITDAEVQTFSKYS